MLLTFRRTTDPFANLRAMLKLMQAQGPGALGRGKSHAVAREVGADAVMIQDIDGTLILVDVEPEVR